jgi:putative ABC transport system permease protein
VPGVTSAALGSQVPLDGSSFVLSFLVAGRAPIRESDQPSANIRSVTPDYFKVLGTPLLRGRAFSTDDRDGGPRVAIVNQAFVKKNFPNEEPLGKTVNLGWSIDGVRQGGMIVGVVGDMREDALSVDPDPALYLPYAQTPVEGITIAVRTAVPPASVAKQLGDAVHSIDQTLPLYGVKTMEERIAGSVDTQRFYATLLTLFAVVALVLAAIGLYSVIAYAVGQRTHELGIRVALGATGDRITAMVVREGIAMTMVGAIAGLLASVAAAKWLASLLFNVKSTDPLTFGGVVVVLGLVAALASYLPARRAARVDPLAAMRGD